MKEYVEERYIKSNHFVVDFDKVNVGVPEWDVATIEYLTEHTLKIELMDRIFFVDGIKYTTESYYPKDRYCGNIKISHLSDDGEALYTEDLYHCVIKQILPGKLDYKSDSIHKINFVIEFREKYIKIE